MPALPGAEPAARFTRRSLGVGGPLSRNKFSPALSTVFAVSADFAEENFLLVFYSLARPQPLSFLFQSLTEP